MLKRIIIANIDFKHCFELLHLFIEYFEFTIHDIVKHWYLQKVSAKDNIQDRKIEKCNTNNIHFTARTRFAKLLNI